MDNDNQYNPEDINKPNDDDQNYQAYPQNVDPQAENQYDAQNQYNYQSQYVAQQPQQQYTQPYNKYAQYNTGGQQYYQNSYQNAQYSYAKPAVVAPVTRIDMIFGFIIFIALFLVTRWGFHGKMALGFSISASILTVVTFLYLIKSNFKIKPFPLICAIAVIACACVYALYLTYEVRFILFFVMIGLYTLMVITMCGFLEYPIGTYGIVLDLFKSIIIYPFKFFLVPFRSAFSKSNGKKSNNARRVLVGVLLALPALMVILPLLVSSDFAFERFITKLFGDLALILFQLVSAFIIFAFVFAMIFANVKNVDKADEKAQRNPRPRPFDIVITTSFLVIISIVYLTYLLTQLAYFTSAFQSTLPAEFFASQYARRGFFEMCVIICINIVLVGVIMLNVKRVNKNELPMSIKIMSAFIMFFSAVVIFTSLSKMWMYIDRFGMTPLRILTSGFMIMLLFILLFITIRIFVKNFAYMKGIITTCIVIGLCISFVDVNTLVARYNTEAYLSGKHEDIDVNLLRTLDNSAVPSLIRLMDSDDVEVRIKTARALKPLANIALDYEKDAITGIRVPMRPHFEFMDINKTDYEAKMLLYENYDKYIGDIE